MTKHGYVLPAVAIALVAACAHGGTGGSGGNSTGDTNTNGSDASTGSNDTPGSSTPGGNGGPMLNLMEASAPAMMMSDGGPSLGENGSVGLCVTTRTCDMGKCDELQEGGQHEYVEQHPDDGSQIPFKDVPTAQAAFQATATTSNGPCVVEPPDGALFPNNWVRARIRVKAPAAMNNGQPVPAMIYQIRIHADRQAQDLIVYTESKTWEIPKDIWTALAASTWGEDVTVTVTAVGAKGGTPASSQVKFQIAPALANGSIIYWTAVSRTNHAGAWLESFGVGDENVAVALTTPQVQWRQSRRETGQLQTMGTGLPPGSPDCVGCHVAVPDRQTVTFIEDFPWDGVASMVDPADTGKLPTWLTPAGAEALSMPWLGMMAFSPHVWNDLKQHLMVVAMQNESTWGMNAPDGGVNGAPFPPWGFEGGNEWDLSPLSQIGWVDLSSPAPSIFANATDAGAVNGDQMSLAMAANYGTSWGVIPRIGDPSGAASPTWSHLTGDTIVYASTNASRSGREGPSPSPVPPGSNTMKGVADLWSVPFANGAGGMAAPIAGASDPKFNEYYPAFSPDDQFIAFNRTPVADDMYYAPNSEVYIVPATGGTAVRLKANDAPACMNVKSPGITNSWPKWSPEYPNCNGIQYYWLIFSSTREGLTLVGDQEPASQLYLTALVQGETGLTSYPGVFIWNQHTKASGVSPFNGMVQSNHTPQWEGVDLPVPPPPPPPPPPMQPPT